MSPVARANIAAGYTVLLSAAQYMALSSPVARRLYRLLRGRARRRVVSAGALRSPSWPNSFRLAQRYPSHLQRVLQPAHEMLIAAGLLRDVAVQQQAREWYVEYALANRTHT